MEPVYHSERFTRSARLCCPSDRILLINQFALRDRPKILAGYRIVHHALILVDGNAAVKVAHTGAIGQDRATRNDGPVNFGIRISTTGIDHVEIALNDDQPEVAPCLSKVHGEISANNKHSLARDSW